MYDLQHVYNNIALIPDPANTRSDARRSNSAGAESDVRLKDNAGW